jgi:uncharacterized membrane protein SirB2
MEQPWLLEKIALVIVYIGLGFILLKQKEKPKQFFILIISTISLLLIGYLAGTKNSFLL